MAKGVYVGVNGIAQKVKKMYVGTGPVTYSEVEYIQSSGAQYIDTGHTWTSENVKVEMGFEYLSLGANSLFGSETTSSSKYSIVPYVDTTSVSFYVGSSTKLCSVPVSINTHYDLICAAANGTLSITTNGSVSSGAYSGSVQNGRSIAVFANNHVNGVTQHSSLKLKYCRMYDNGTLVRDFVPCQTSTGAIGLYDKVESKFYSNAGSGTFTAGAEIETIKTTGIARKVKKGYVGIGGVARPFFTGGELAYYGTATALSSTRSQIAATTVGNYALFAGGTGDDSWYASDVIDAYNGSLTRSSISALTEYRRRHSAVTLGDYALFGFGEEYNVSQENSTHGTIEPYNSSLTKQTLLDTYSPRAALAATVVGNYALFGGGYDDDDNELASIYYYNKSLSRGNTNLTYGRSYLSAATTGSYALFVGGSGSTGGLKVDSVSSSMVVTNQANLASRRGYMTGLSFAGYALFFGGGSTSSAAVSEVIGYNSSLTKVSVPSMGTGMTGGAGTVVGDFAVIAVGATGMNSTNIVEVYDKSLTRQNQMTLSESRKDLAGTTVGNFALFGGGVYSQSSPYVNTYKSTVDVYTVG